MDTTQQRNTAMSSPTASVQSIAWQFHTARAQALEKSMARGLGNLSWRYDRHRGLMDNLDRTWLWAGDTQVVELWLVDGVVKWRFTIGP